MARLIRLKDPSGCCVVREKIGDQRREGSRGWPRGVGEKWSDLRNILKAEPTGLANGLVRMG